MYDTIIALILNKDGGEDIFQYSKNGTVYKDMESDADLMMESEHHEGWQNIYRAKQYGDYYGGLIFKDEESAKNDEYNEDELEYINTIHIEWED